MYCILHGNALEAPLVLLISMVDGVTRSILSVCLYPVLLKKTIVGNPVNMYPVSETVEYVAVDQIRERLVEIHFKFQREDADSADLHSAATRLLNIRYR